MQKHTRLVNICMYITAIKTHNRTSLTLDFSEIGTCSIEPPNPNRPEFPQFLLPLFYFLF